MFLDQNAILAKLKYSILLFVLLSYFSGNSQNKEEKINEVWLDYLAVNEIADRNNPDSLSYVLDSLLLQMDINIESIKKELKEEEVVGMQFIRTSAAQNASVYAMKQEKVERMMQYLKPKYKELLEFKPVIEGRFWVKFRLYNISKGKFKDAQYNLLSVLYNLAALGEDKDLKLDVSKRLLEEPRSSVFNKAVSCMLLTTTYFQQKDTVMSFEYGTRFMQIYADLSPRNKVKLYNSDGFFRINFPNMLYAGLKHENSNELEAYERIESYIKIVDGNHESLSFYLKVYRVVMGWVDDKNAAQELLERAKKEKVWFLEQELKKYLNSK